MDAHVWKVISIYFNGVKERDKNCPVAISITFSANSWFHRRQNTIVRTSLFLHHRTSSAAKPTPAAATTETAFFPAPFVAVLIDVLAVDVEVPVVVAGLVAWT